MEKKFRALKKITFFSAFLLPFMATAQEEVGDVFRGTPADAGKLAEAYLAPATTAFGLGLNSGWYNTAKAKNFLRFDFRVSATLAIVPEKDKTFDVNALGLTSMKAVSSNTFTPSISGPKNDGTRMQIDNDPNKEFNLPQGLNIGYVPSPQLQFTIGLPKNIDVSVRYIPTIDLKDMGKVDLFGVGAKLEVLPIILGKTEKLIPFDLALAVGYTEMNWNIPLKVGSNPDPNQKLNIKSSGVSVDAIVSKKVAVLTPFVSVGYNNANTTLQALGNYDFDGETFNNPFSIKREDVNGMKASIGFQLNLAVFKLYASYTQAKYGYANAGIGLGFGK